MFKSGDRVIWDGKRCTVLKAFKNGSLKLECWVETFGLPKLMKFRINEKYVEAA